MSRFDESPEERYQIPLSFTQIVECPECGIEFDAVFVAEGVYDIEFLTESPEAELECPSCGQKSSFTYEGWTAHEDAG